MPATIPLRYALTPMYRHKVLGTACILLVLLLCAPALAAPDWAALRSQLENDPVGISQLAQGYLTELRQNGDQAQQLEALTLVVEARIATEDYDQVEQALAAAQQLARQLNNDTVNFRLLMAQAALTAAHGQPLLALPLYDQAAQLALRQRSGREQVAVLIEKSSLLVQLSRYNEALLLLVQANDLAEKLALPREASKSLGSMGNVQAKLGHFSAAYDYYQKAIAKLNPKEDKYLLSVVTYDFAKTQLDAGNVWQSEELFKESLGYSNELHDLVGVAFARYQLGTLALKKGLFETARRQLEPALAEFVRTQNLDLQLRVRLVLAEVFAAQRAGQSALAALSAARQLVLQKPTVENELLLHQSSSVVHRSLGHYKEALTAQDAWLASKQQKDDLFNRKLIAEMQEQFNVKKQEVENNLLKSEQRRQAAELASGEQRRLILMFALAGGFLLLVGMGYFLFAQMKSKRAYADLALRDALTGAPNRRHILHYAKLQLKACAATGNELSLAVIDLDHFKSINDRFGHDTGDAVLKAFATATLGELRGGDRIGRYGGEEWLLVLPSTRQEQASAVFARLRNAVRDQHPAEVPAEIVLSFSMGVAQALPHEDLEDLLQRADRAMYQAKEKGRDQVAVAPAE